MKKKYFAITMILLAVSFSTKAQIGINTTIPATTLDIRAKNGTGTSSDVEGILIPRVDRERAQSMISIPTSTLIYVNSIATGTLTGNAVNIDAVGYYYYDGSAWLKLNAPTSNDWKLTGNSGIIAGMHFLGTTDNQDLIFKRNNIQAGWLNSATNNTAFGVNALPNTATGTTNAAFGTSALAAITTGSGNIAVGHMAAKGLMTGGNNIAIGRNALSTNTAGFRNIALGENTLFSATGNENVAVGINTASSLTLGINNTVIGNSALMASTTGNSNVAIGYNALNTNTTGSNNTAIGYNAGVNTNNLTNATAIGFNAKVNQSNSLVLGGTGADAVNVGIGTATPNKKLEVNAATDYLRITNLFSIPATTATNLLVIDPLTGNVGQSADTNVAGQIIRIGINQVTFNGTETALRFSNHNSATEMGNAPNGQPNYINTINGATFTESIAASSGVGSPSRTTDQINLPVGVYKLTVKTSQNSSSQHDQYFLKVIVNNNEYSLQEFGSSGSGKDGLTFVEYLNLGTNSTLDFTMQNLSANRDVNIIDRANPGSGNSYRSIIMIEKVK